VGSINIFDFSKVKIPISPPDLLEIQRSSFNWFKEVGLKELLDEFNASEEITHTGKAIIEFVNYEILEPRINAKECKERGKTYGGILRLTVKITFTDTGEIKEQTISVGEIPLMTPTGSFIINGVERVVIGQLTRSPGVYFEVEPYSSSKHMHRATVIPDRGSWLEFETDIDGTTYIHLDKKSKKIFATTVLRAFGFTDDDFKNAFTQENIVSIDPHSANFLNACGKRLADDIYDFETGEDLYKAGTILDAEIISNISKMPINTVKIIDEGVLSYIKCTLEKDDVRTQEEAKKLIFMKLRPGERYTPENADNQFRMILTDPRRNDLGEVGRYKINKKLGLNLTDRTVTSTDIVEIIKYFSKIDMDIGKPDNRDHLGNKRVRLVGELLKNSMRIGFLRVIRFMLDKISITPEEEISVQSVINTRPLIAAINEFFGLGQLSQFMDETNPIASLTHKRRVSSLGPGGLHRERAGAEVRDIHHSHYGRLCPIETPEGENIGLINSLTIYSKIDKFGFIITPYLRVENGRVLKEIVYLTADDEEKYYIAQANTPVDEDGNILTEKCAVRFKEDVIEVLKEEVNYIDISPMQVFSASANLIPFLEHDDANRALMGCNMEHQAVPLIFPEMPLVGTALEEKVAIDSGAVEIANEDGVVSYVDSSKISISSTENGIENVKIGHFNKELLNDVLAENIPPIANVGEIIDGVLINKLLRNGIEMVRHFDPNEQEILDEHTITRFVGTTVNVKNDEIIGFISAETILRKNGKPIVKKGQKITDTILSRLMIDKVQKVKICDEEGNILEKVVYTEKVIREETLPKNKILISSEPIFDSANAGKTLDLKTLENLKQKGAVRVSLVDVEKIKESPLFIISKKLSRPVVIGRDVIVGSKVVAKEGDVLDKKLLLDLIDASITEIAIGKEKDYILDKFRRTNQDTVINKYPLVQVGDYVKKGDSIINGEACDRGHLALGRNLLVAYMPWRGWNYQDAIVVSERIVTDDLLTSLHIKEYKVSVRNTKVGPEEVTRDIPNVPEDQLRNLDENGIIRIGTEVGPNDILVGKITPKAESEFTPEMKLWRAMFDKKGQDVKDSSLRVSPGDHGTVIGVQILEREEEENLPIGVNKIIKVYIGEKRKIQVGDKLSGRHGNKGVISRILPISDMPFLEDGTPVDIVLNPLGVPSRMNVGQILEALLGLVARKEGFYSYTPPFIGATIDEVLGLLEKAGFENEGKMRLYDGLTGDPFDNKVTVGYAYIMKLNHMVEDKIHARSTGPYALITQQPLGGKAQFGGQRFGEMEVWALEAYGAAYTLQEMLTIKSDDTEGRLNTYESICQRKLISQSNNPESFRVIISELQGLGIKMDLVKEEEGERLTSDLFNNRLDLGGTVK
jgi:DNA-directed RNA polymerase subunit beta